MGGKKEMGEQCQDRLASLLRQEPSDRKRKAQGEEVRRRSEDDEKGWSRIKHLMCVVRKMSATGRIGKGLRWDVSQLGERCKQRWTSDMHELVLGDGKFG